MNRTATEGSLEIEVTDFGPIVRANVNLRPLTVFVGPSNTGKSYLAILIYALHRFFGSDGDYDAWWPIGRNPLLFFPVPGPSDDTVQVHMDMAHQALADLNSADSDGIVLTPAVADMLRHWFDTTADAIAGEIGRCFGVGETQVLTRKGQKTAARIAMRRRMNNGSVFGNHMLSLGRKTTFKTTFPAGVPIPTDYGTADAKRYYEQRILSMLDDGKGDAKRRKVAALELTSMVSQSLIPSAFGFLRLPAFYLPADRTGVMHAHSVVVSALIESATMAGIRPVARTPMLSGVLADFLKQLIEIDQPRRAPRGHHSDLGTGIEKDVLDGLIRIDRSEATDYPRFAYRPMGWKDDLALANASSMVSEIAPVVLYLRHLVGPGNVLIVEEPESHLHPAMQVKFTRQLAALVNAGVHLIVTTHSEWLLEELGNVVRRSDLPKSKRGDLESGVALRPEQVGTWLFEPKSRPKGSIVKEIRLDDTGLYPTGYDAVSMALHNDWAELNSRIKGSS